MLTERALYERRCVASADHDPLRLRRKRDVLQQPGLP